MRLTMELDPKNYPSSDLPPAVEILCSYCRATKADEKVEAKKATSRIDLF